jgi:hypothetical protein
MAKIVYTTCVQVPLFPDYTSSEDNANLPRIYLLALLSGVSTTPTALFSVVCVKEGGRQPIDHSYPCRRSSLEQVV